jgi:hypothetical protein
MILVAPFDSLVEVGKRVYPFLPVELAAQAPFRFGRARPQDESAASVYRRGLR